MSDYNNDDIKDTEDEQKYEDVCYMCRRPESKTGRMLHIPGMNNMRICIDCCLLYTSPSPRDTR